MSELSDTPFRLYTAREQGDGVQCAVSTDDVSLGEALLEQHRRGRKIVGIMYRPVDGEPGEWLVNPWSSPTSVEAALLRSAADRMKAS